MKRFLTPVLFGLLLDSQSSLRAEPAQVEFSFGAIADCQYCNVPDNGGVRKYRLSVEKLQACVEHFNTLDLAFVTHLGDFIDKDFASFDAVGPIFEKLKAPRYHVLGNHDFSVADDLKHKVVAKLGMDSRYYDFKVKGWRYVVLDGNDISFHAYPSDSTEYAKAVAYYEQNKITSPKWNGAVGPEQILWLRNVLEKAAQQNEKVILFCHFPIFPENKHNLWNAEEIIALLEQYPCVKAYINGHNHQGNYGTKNGIHYLTLKGMVDTEQTSYAVISTTENTIHVAGHGREPDRDMVVH
ncbi:MAG: hypothetical protein HN341_16240 [Verrucomicrobia bacterium]|nr:hypothetical protein [Verrucomicrobiota bacterium]